MARNKVQTWIAWGFLLAAGWLVFTLFLIIAQGREWDYGIVVNHPKKRMLAAFLALAGWVFCRRGATPWAGWKGKAGRVVLLAMAMLVSAVAAEITLRVVLDRNQGDGSIEKLAAIRGERGMYLDSFHPLAAIVRLSPNKKLVYELMSELDMEFGHRTLKTNQDGMRERRDYARQKPADVLRIVGIGDSGMFGWNTDQGENYLAVLERELEQEAGKVRCEVLNLAVPGYNTGQQLEMLRHRGLAYAPDIVIVGWCDNDFSLPFFMTQPVDYARLDASFLYELLFRRDEFRKLVEPPARRGAAVDPGLVDPALASYTGVEGVARAFAELKALGAERNFRLLVFGPMNAHAVRICEDLGIDYFNTHERIPRGRHPAEYAIHFMHPSTEGHRVLAQELHAFLHEKGWLPAL